MMQAQIIVGNPEDMLKERRNRWVNAFGRLKPGISQQQAKAALQPFMHSMLEMEVQLPAFSRASKYDRDEFLKCWIDVLPGSQGRSHTRRQLSTPLWVLMATTGAVLLIACANLANLMLVRGSSRVKEIAVRLAMGATRPRIIGQLLIESLSLSALGGLAGLVFAQVTLSLLLLVGAGLFVRSLANLRNLGPGFSPERLVGFQIDPSLNGYTPERLKVFYPQMTDVLSAIPGVRAVGLASMRILEDNEWDSSMSVEGFSPAKPDEHAEPYMNAISPNYFATLGVPIVAGRDFTMNDSHI